jgi:hypothetical protein
MKTFLKISVIMLIFLACFVIPGCGPATHVSVGVGVGVPGAWGPYPGGSVWVGTPVYPPYYYPVNPENDKNREFVWNDIGGWENMVENPQNTAGRKGAEIPYRLSE